MPAASDVQLYDGMLSGSVLAASYPTDTLIDGTTGNAASEIIAVSDVVLTVGGIQANSQVVLLRLGLWYLRPGGGQIQIASFRFGATTTAHDPPIPPTFHVNHPVPAPEAGCSLILGFQAYATQPGGADTALVNGVGAVRCYYSPVASPGILLTGGAG